MCETAIAVHVAWSRNLPTGARGPIERREIGRWRALGERRGVSTLRYRPEAASVWSRIFIFDVGELWHDGQRAPDSKSWRILGAFFVQRFAF